MAESVLQLSGPMARLVVNTTEAIIVLPKPAEVPNSLGNIIDSNSMVIGMVGSAAELDLAPPTTISIGSWYSELHVSRPPITDNLACAEAIAIVVGESIAGLKLEISGAFEDKSRSAFFWG